jgi:hypothetical protein
MKIENKTKSKVLSCSTRPYKLEEIEIDKGYGKCFCGKWVLIERLDLINNAVKLKKHINIFGQVDGRPRSSGR